MMFMVVVERRAEVFPLTATCTLDLRSHVGLTDWRSLRSAILQRPRLSSYSLSMQQVLLLSTYSSRESWLYYFGGRSGFIDLY